MILKQLGKQIAKYTQEKPIDALLMLFFALIVVILASLYFSVDFNDEHWEEFKAEHHCQLRTSKTGTQRASWTCDDGQTYFRWRQQR